MQSHCRTALFILILGIAAACPLPAQDDGGNSDGSPPTDMRYTVITTKGDTLTGTYVRWSSDTLLLRAPDDAILRVRRGDIARVVETAVFEEEADETSDADAIVEAFHQRPPSGLLLHSTAWPKSDGQVEISLYEFMFLGATVSLQDIITFTGMTSFVLGDDNVAGFGMKLSPLVTESVALAGGVYAIEGYDRGTEGIRLYYFCGSFMVGSGSLTIGYSHFEDDDEQVPIPYLGFDIPVSSRIRAMVELSRLSRGIGVRMQLGRAMIELGVLQVASRGDYATAPWLGLGVVM